MSDDAIRRTMARLAAADDFESSAGDPLDSAEPTLTFRETIERATAAVGDVEAAACFVEGGGLEDLKRAVERADRSVSARADDGRRALVAFREFREVAGGDHFHRGRGTSLGGGDIIQTK